MKKVIITGSSGMVGKGVLLACLESSFIEKVLVVNRSSIYMQHPKLEEVLLADFIKVETIKDRLYGYDACFYCMGVSAIGMKEEDYFQVTFKTVQSFANVLYSLSPDIVFIYVSGAGTDSSEKGSMMWARVKGKTENMILNKGFGDAYAFRPGIILPEKGIRSRTGWYNAAHFILRPLFPLLKKLDSVTTTSKVGHAMINSLRFPSDKKILENKDINQLAAK